MFLPPDGPTAIIAPYDEHARRLYRWLIVLGVRIPEDLSLVSFDDRQELLYPYTISSVNFGFANLGYAAFHSIIGDVPIKIDRRRSLGVASRLNHFATIGQARLAHALSRRSAALGVAPATATAPVRSAARSPGNL
jgi:DNA-binding LacI/PurR family transcriptional regulator